MVVKLRQLVLCATTLAVTTLPLLAATADARADTNLKVWTIPWDDVATTAFHAMISDFEAANPTIKVSAESRSIDEHKAAMRVAANSGTGPDIYYMWGGLGLGGDFVNAGVSAPLADAYAHYGWSDRFLPAALADSVRYKGGERHGMPFLIHGEGLYYNKTLFTKAGIQAPPATYAELMQDLVKLKAAHVPAITFGGSVNWHLMRLMDELLETKCGAQTHDALIAMTADWSKESCATDAFTELKRWTDGYMLKPFMGLSDAQAQGLFYNGRVAMALEGDWFAHMLGAHGVKDRTGLFLFPTGTGRLYFFSEYFYVNAHGGNKEASETFLNFITSPGEQQKYLGKFSVVSVDNNVNYSSEPQPLEKQWIDFIQGAKGTFVNGDQGFPVAMTTEYWRIINQIATGEVQPAQAAQEMQKAIADHHH